MVWLAWRYLWARPLAALLNLLLMTLGLGSITFVLLAGEQVQRGFERDLAGIDLVVGAKGSPLQLILAGVFHIDVPSGNIPLREVRTLEKNPLVARLVPLSLGDSFRGFRIVGTTPAYAAHYRAVLSEGSSWTAALQAVAGAEVARSTGLRVGARFAGSHGLAGGAAHEDHAYTVTGVLAPCGCVLDRLILTATESVWETHETHAPAATAPAPATAPASRPAHAGPAHAKAHAHSDAHADEDEHEDRREVTLALITYRTPLAAASLPRQINTGTGMQAASPALEVSRLLRMVGVGTDIVRAVGAVLLLTAALGVFIALWSAVRERRADLAMLRLLGAPPWRVAGVLACEALWLALLASVLGLALGHGLVEVVGRMLQAQRSISISGSLWLPAEAWIPAAAAGVALLAALIPVVSAYRMDVARALGAR